MKINIWKFTTLLFAIVIVSLFTLTSFKSKSVNNSSSVGEGQIIATRAEVKQLYNNFSRQYPENFNERGGIISKSTLQALIGKMKDAGDVNVYYYFARTDEGKNVIMLFNDPTFNSLDNTNKYVTVAPFCPPNCNMTLNDYITLDK